MTDQQATALVELAACPEHRRVEHRPVEDERPVDHRRTFSVMVEDRSTNQWEIRHGTIKAVSLPRAKRHIANQSHLRLLSIG